MEGITMSNILVCKQNENLLLKKSKAFKYKEIDLTALNCGTAFDLEDKEDKLVGVATDDVEENPIYSIVTNEFGLYAKSSNVKAKVKISFCDDGMMIVDVLDGAVIIKPEDDILLASRGVSELPQVNLDSIYWVNTDTLLSYRKYWKKLQSSHPQDFEFVFVLSGENRGGLTSFGIQLVTDEVIDISGGAIAVLESQMEKKEEAKQVKKGFNSLLQQTSSASGYEFDDDDEDEEDEDAYDEDDDVFDGSNY